MALTTALTAAFEACFQNPARQQGIDLEDLSLAEYTQRLVQGLQALGARALERHTEDEAALKARCAWLNGATHPFASPCPPDPFDSCCVHPGM